MDYALKQELNIKNIKENLKIDEEDKTITDDELAKVNNLVPQSDFVFKEFSSEQYLLYKNCFIKNIPKKRIFKENYLTKSIRQKLLDIYDNFTDLKGFEKSLEIIEKNENNNNDENLGEILKESIKILFEENKNIYDPKQLSSISKQLDKNLNDFLSISKSSRILTKLKSENLNIDKFLNSNEISFKILVLGKYSSGKSSLLNSIIGYNLDLLDTSENECTKKAFVIKYCEGKEDISLIKAEVKQNDYNFYYFEEKELIIKGLDNVKRKIKEINNEIGRKFEYYIIKTPIESFNHFTESTKQYIELIDLPGFDIADYNNIIFNSEKMINYMDGLIYVNNGSSFENDINLGAIENLINKIRECKINFSFKSTFFVYTHADKYKMTIDKFSSTITKIINEKYKMQNFINILKQDQIMRNKDEILFSKFSNEYYKDYQKFKHFQFSCTTISDLYAELLKNYLIITEEELNNYSANENELQITKDKIKTLFGIKDDNEMVQNVAKLYLFISDNIDRNNKYKNSNAKDFFKNFNSLIINTEDNYYYQLTYFFKNFINKIYSQLVKIKFFMYKLTPNFLSEEEISKRRNNIIDYRIKCKEKINSLIDNFLFCIMQEIKNLKKYCGKKEFNDKLKEFDDKLNKEKNNLGDNIKQNITLFNSQCFDEVKMIQNKVFGDSYTSFILDLRSHIFAEKVLLASRGVSAVIFGGAGLLGLMFTSAIALPVIGIVLGGIGLISPLKQFFVNLFKKKEKIHEEYISNYLEQLSSTIDSITTKLDNEIIKISESYLEQIVEINDLQMENPKEYLQEKDKFEVYLYNLKELIKNMKAIDEN